MSYYCDPTSTFDDEMLEFLPRFPKNGQIARVRIGRNKDSEYSRIVPLPQYIWILRGTEGREHGTWSLISVENRLFGKMSNQIYGDKIAVYRFYQ